MDPGGRRRKLRRRANTSRRHSMRRRALVSVPRLLLAWRRCGSRVGAIDLGAELANIPPRPVFFRSVSSLARIAARLPLHYSAPPPPCVLRPASPPVVLLVGPDSAPALVVGTPPAARAPCPLPTPCRPATGVAAGAAGAGGRLSGAAAVRGREACRAPTSPANLPVEVCIFFLQTS